MYFQTERQAAQAKSSVSIRKTTACKMWSGRADDPTLKTTLTVLSPV
jgi:hypothetical protein